MAKRRAGHNSIVGQDHAGYSLRIRGRTLAPNWGHLMTDGMLIVLGLIALMLLGGYVNWVTG